MTNFSAKTSLRDLLLASICLVIINLTLIYRSSIIEILPKATTCLNIEERLGVTKQN